MKKSLKAYHNTKVNWAKSQAEIQKLLEKHGIKETRFTNLSADTMIQAGFDMEKNSFAIMLEFFKTTTLSNRLGGRIPIRIIIPDLPDEEKAKNQAFRIFFWYLKTKFEAVESGLVEFEQEFMPHIALGKGNPTGNMYQAFKEKILPKIVGGQDADIKMISSPTNKS